MKVISVNVALPQEVIWKSMPVQTAVFKEPVDGTVAITKLNLAGDKQADLSVHGGSEKAGIRIPLSTTDTGRKSCRKYRFHGVCSGRTLRLRACGKTRCALPVFCGSGLPF